MERERERERRKEKKERKGNGEMALDGYRTSPVHIWVQITLYMRRSPRP
jgi:hypothetical protein